MPSILPDLPARLVRGGIVLGALCASLTLAPYTAVVQAQSEPVPKNQPGKQSEKQGKPADSPRVSAPVTPWPSTSAPASVPGSLPAAVPASAPKGTKPLESVTA